MVDETEVDFQVVIGTRGPEDPGEVVVGLSPDSKTVPVVYFELVRCPYCSTDKVKQYGSSGRVKYYRCTVCVTPNTGGDWTRFKAIEGRSDGATRGGGDPPRRSDGGTGGRSDGGKEGKN